MGSVVEPPKNMQKSEGMMSITVATITRIDYGGDKILRTITIDMAHDHSFTPSK